MWTKALEKLTKDTEERKNQILKRQKITDYSEEEKETEKLIA
jgi:hypothetical protein